MKDISNLSIREIELQRRRLEEAVRAAKWELEDLEMQSVKRVYEELGPHCLKINWTRVRNSMK